MDAYDHLVHVDEPEGKLVIYRILADGSRELYTSAKVPSPDDARQCESFARELGQNLLVDSPVARKLLKL